VRESTVGQAKGRKRDLEEAGFETWPALWRSGPVRNGGTRGKLIRFGDSIRRSNRVDNGGLRNGNGTRRATTTRHDKISLIWKFQHQRGNRCGRHRHGRSSDKACLGLPWWMLCQ